MITTTLCCGCCSSPHLRKNGSSHGRRKYQCTSCGYQGYVQPAGPARAARYAQVEKLLVERVSQRATVRLIGVARMTVAKLAKKAQIRPITSRLPVRPRV
jgi:transposase-like protein